MNASLKSLACAIAVCLAGAGCSSVTIRPEDTTSIADLKQELVKFTKEDVTEALAMAVEDKDIIASVCWYQVGQFLENIPPEQSAHTVKGAASAFQKARSLARKLDKGPEIPVELRLGCSALFTDTQVLAARLRNLGR